MPSKFVRRTIALLIGFTSGQALALDEPQFDVVANVNGIEYRQYQPYVVAETLVAEAEDRDDASNQGFRRLFAYISGDNRSQTEISMTAPVRQSSAGTEIAMTAPVRQTNSDSGWAIAFVLPAKYTLDTAPEPLDSNVQLQEVPGELVAALRYSGRWTDKNIDRHKAELMEKLVSASIKPTGAIVTAFYNAPFSLPFMRRNEVMVTVDRLPEGGD